MKVVIRNVEEILLRANKLEQMGLEIISENTAACHIEGDRHYFDFSATATDMLGVELARQAFGVGYEKGQVNLKRQMRNLLDIPNPQE